MTDTPTVIGVVTTNDMPRNNHGTILNTLATPHNTARNNTECNSVSHSNMNVQQCMPHTSSVAVLEAAIGV
jgi:hypothetical protein